ncbi:hypothetical protein [Streptosporangium lutulentum]|uniref:Uncharacterized protein n=1 Tax=Streptosporangium lutulentum TaxID=1461250 RepID=A0ABT9Q984_9ACTN|nr:hypothetical protein [Streptosporangium lutulentum]MDP9843298.1 hypothetical protein [Streptosporangium lutulentum]
MSDVFTTAYHQFPQECGHLRNPQPVFGTLREMGFLRCQPCFDAYTEAETWSTCDRCGANRGDVSSSAVTRGPLVLMLHLCASCTAASLAEQE